MSADNYIYVRKRQDGKFGVSMRFASIDYADEETEYDERFLPPDEYGVFDTPSAALNAAHRAEMDEPIVEYGVTVGPGVLL